MFGHQRPRFLNDPGTGGGGGGFDGVIYDDTFFVNTKTSTGGDGGVSGGGYNASGKLISQFVNDAVTDIGPCHGKYDPELSVIFGGEI